VGKETRWGGGVLPSVPQQSTRNFPLLFLFFFFLIIIVSKSKVLSGNLKACGCTEGRRGAAACQGKGPKRGGIPSTPSGSSPHLLPPVRPLPAWHFLGKGDTAEQPDCSFSYAGRDGSETAVAGKKKELFCLFKQACQIPIREEKQLFDLGDHSFLKQICASVCPSH